MRVSAAEPDKPDCWHAGRHQIPRHGAALLESSDAGVAVTIGPAVLTIRVCTVLGSVVLALLMLVAVAGIAGLTIAAL